MVTYCDRYGAAVVTIHHQLEALRVCLISAFTMYNNILRNLQQSIHIHACHITRLVMIIIHRPNNLVNFVVGMFKR